MARHADQLLAEAQRLTDQASVLWNVGSYPRTEALCRRALKLTRAAAGNRDPRVAERLYNLATLYHFQRRFEEAKPLYREAILIHHAQPQVDERALAFCHAWLAKTLFEAWRHDPGIDGNDENHSFIGAEASYREALTLLQKAGGGETPEYTGCLMQLGFLYYYLDRFAAAEPPLRQALVLCELLFGPDHLETAESAGRLGILYWHDNDATVDPEPFLRRALDIRQRLLDSTDAEVWEWTYRLAEYCLAFGQSEEADLHFDRLTEMLLDGAAPIHDDVDWIVTGCREYLLETGRKDTAARIDARWNQESSALRSKRLDLRHCETMLGADHPRVADALFALGEELRLDERNEEALKLYQRALTVRETADGHNASSLLPILNGIAMVRRCQDQMKDARAVLERAYRIPVAKGVHEERLQHARAVEQLAWVCAAEDDVDLAETLFQSAVSLVETTDPCDYREIAEMRYRLSIFYAQESRYEIAGANVSAALHAAERTADLDELEMADFREQYATILVELGRRDEAEVQLSEVRRIWEESGVPRGDLAASPYEGL